MARGLTAGSHRDLLNEDLPGMLAMLGIVYPDCDASAIKEVRFTRNEEATVLFVSMVKGRREWIDAFGWSGERWELTRPENRPILASRLSR